MNITTDFIENLTSLVSGALTALGQLIASPVGWLIIFGLAISYLFYIKQLWKTSNARV